MAGEESALGGDVGGPEGSDVDLLEGGDDERHSSGEAPEEGEAEEEGEAPPDGEGEEGEDSGEGTGEGDDVDEEDESDEESDEDEDEGEEKDEEGEEKPEVEEPGAQPPPTGGEAGRLVARVEKEFKGVFKKFPELRRAVFRDRAYNEIFSTVDGAREAQEKAETFDDHEVQLMNGNVGALLKVVGEQDPNALVKLSENFLPTLERVSPNLVGKVLFPYIRDVLSNALSSAQSSGNKNLQHSVGHLSQFLFKQFELPPPPKKNEGPTEQETQANRRVQELEGRINGQFEAKATRVAYGRLSQDIDRALAGETRLTPYERRALRGEIFRRVTSALDQDARYNKNILGIWARAKREGYQDAHVSRIGDAFLEGARGLLPTIRAKALQEVLKEKGAMGKDGKAKDGKQKKKTVIEHPNSGGTKGGLGKGKKVDSSRSIDYNSTSDTDILEGNIRYRK